MSSIRWWRLLSLVLLLAPAALAAQSKDAARAVGDWVFEMSGDAQPQRVSLAADGDSVRGRVYGSAFAGTLSGQRLSFRVGSYAWRATLDGDSLRGWLGVGNDSSRWTGRRFRPPVVPRSFMLAPLSFHRGVSATATPALTIYPGDTVRTTTLDAAGWGTGAFGQRGNKLASGGNPLTGPFYVEGAVPGDVLAVRLHRVRLNRGWAFSGTELMESAIEPGYARDRKPGRQDNKWTLDTIRGVARLTTPPAALKDYTVPLTPFLGVVAVAPGGEWTPSSRESGSWGGNMEYARFTSGTTVYLPVSTMGAYLYLGDGHAAQGDGELTGDAMETSMDVVFSVDVVRWGFASMTRAEDADHIMSVGVGGSLDDAMRRATSDLARWLERTYKLSSTEAALVMGFAVKYDIPDVVPPGFGVTARLPKSALRALTPEPSAK